MSSYRQNTEKKIEKLELQARENVALRKENRMLVKSLKSAQATIKILSEENIQPNYSHNEVVEFMKNLNLEIPKGL